MFVVSAHIAVEREAEGDVRGRHGPTPDGVGAGEIQRREKNSLHRAQAG